MRYASEKQQGVSSGGGGPRSTNQPRGVEPTEYPDTKIQSKVQKRWPRCRGSKSSLPRKGTQKEGLTTPQVIVGADGSGQTIATSCSPGLTTYREK